MFAPMTEVLLRPKAFGLPEQGRVREGMYFANLA
jgi:hypothetical protein